MKNKSIYPWVVVGLLWIVALLNYMDRQMLSTMQEAMKVDIVELNKAEAFGALMAIFLWIYGFMSPVAGIIADRVNRKWLVVGSLFVWSAVTFLMGYAHDFHELYWLRAIMGVSEALYIPSALSLIADWHEGKSRSLAVGVHMTGLYVGQAIGGFGATAAAAFSWQATFHWFGIVGIVYSLVLILFLKENPIHNVSSKKIDNVPGEKKPSIISGLSLLFTNWAFWIILFYFAAPSLPGWATKNWLPTLFADSLNIPMSEAGPISTITIAVSSFILNKTKLGRHIYAVGGNKQAAEYSGINVKKVTFFVFVYSALLASLAGILTFTAMMTLGDGAEMDAISAVVLGGTSMNGGRGTIAGTVIGAIVIGVLKNGMNLLGIDSSWQYIVQGIVILIAVYIDWFKQTGFKFSRKIKA